MTKLIILIGAAVLFGPPIGIGFAVARATDPVVGIVAGVVSFIAIVAIAQKRIAKMAGQLKDTMTASRDLLDDIQTFKGRLEEGEDDHPGDNGKVD